MKEAWRSSRLLQSSQSLNTFPEIRFIYFHKTLKFPLSTNLGHLTPITTKVNLKAISNQIQQTISVDATSDIWQPYVWTGRLRHHIKGECSLRKCNLVNGSWQTQPLISPTTFWQSHHPKRKACVKSLASNHLSQGTDDVSTLSRTDEFGAKFSGKSFEFRVLRSDGEETDVDRFVPDAIMVLAGGQTEAGDVPVWVQRRLDVSFELYHKYNAKCPIICLGGGTPHRPPVISPRGYVVHESSSCAEYLLAKGLNPDHVVKEWGSFDTIANGFFALVWHASPRMWCNLAVVTSDFHMARSRLIFEWIFGLDGAEVRCQMQKRALGKNTGTSIAQGDEPWDIADVSGGVGGMNGAWRPSLSSSESWGKEEGVERAQASPQDSAKGDVVDHSQRARRPAGYAAVGSSGGGMEGIHGTRGDEGSRGNGYNLKFFSVTDEGILHKAIEARSEREAKSIENLKHLMTRIRSLPDFHHWFHTEHKAYNVRNQHEFGEIQQPDEDPSLMCY